MITMKIAVQVNLRKITFFFTSDHLGGKTINFCEICAQVILAHCKLMKVSRNFWKLKFLSGMSVWLIIQ